jgi:hypothetical protein
MAAMQRGVEEKLVQMQKQQVCVYLLVSDMQ